LFGGLVVAEQTDELREVSFLVRVCDGDDFLRLLGDEASERWDDCERPLGGIPVFLSAGEEKAGPTETDSNGTVKVGPIEAESTTEIRLGIGCTKHVCLTLRLDPRAVSAGENRFLYHTITQEKMKDRRKDEDGGDS
jgi:hypothetical protein